MSGLTDMYITYRLLRLLSTPIEQSDAYKLGIINAEGKKIKEPSTRDEKDAYTILNRFIFKVQYALAKSPDRMGKRLLTFAAALAILRENKDISDIVRLNEKEFNDKLGLYEMFSDVKQAATLLEHNTIPFKMFREEVAANSAGGGAVHGIGIGPKGEPGRDPVMQPMARRKKKKNGNG